MGRSCCTRGLQDREGHTGARGRGKRTVIPHAQGFSPAALPARALVIPVIETTLGAVSMAAACTAKTVAAGQAGAGRSAVDVAAVARATDRKDRLTTGAQGQAARRVLSHRPPRTAGAAAPRKARENVRQSGRASVWPCNDDSISSTEGPERLLRALASFSPADSTRFPTPANTSPWPGPRAGEPSAPAGANPKSRCFAPDAAKAAGPFESSERSGANQARTVTTRHSPAR